MLKNENAPLWSTSPVARKNTARVADAWYVACASADCKNDGPLSAQVLGVALAIWRTSGGQPAVVVDRCPHRNVPLSLGRVQRDDIECRYHGWRFDRCGQLTAIPGLVADAGENLAAPSRCTQGVKCIEQDGYIWVWLAEAAPSATSTPFRLVQLDDPRKTHVRQSMRINATLHSTLENILDVPHTAFLHGGLFRTAQKKHEIEAVVKRRRDSVEAEFIGEPRPTGLAARLLAPRSGNVTVKHWDRFFLPSIAQVEYQLGDNSVVITTVCTPVAETITDMHSILSIQTTLPVGPLSLLLHPLARKILQQDKEILEAQTKTVEQFGTDRITSTPIDLLGPLMLHLLKKAESGQLDDAIVREERVRLHV